MDFHGFPSMSVYYGKSQPAAPIETFARFQAGFLSSEDFHRFLLIIMDFHDFDGLLGLLGLLKECFASWLCWKEA